MKVETLEQIKREFGLQRPKGTVLHTLFYLAVGESESEYRFDFLGSAIYDYLCNPLVAQADKLHLLGILHRVVKADSSMHLWRIGSLVSEQDLFHDWCKKPSLSCEPLKDGTRMESVDFCSGCGGRFDYHFHGCEEF